VIECIIAVVCVSYNDVDHDDVDYFDVIYSRVSVSMVRLFVFTVANPLALGLPPMMAADGMFTAIVLLHTVIIHGVS